jgi:hypothetical protein
MKVMMYYVLIINLLTIPVKRFKPKVENDQ